MFPYGPCDGAESGVVVEMLKVLARPGDKQRQVEANVGLVFEYLKAVEKVEKQREAVRREERKRLSAIDDLRQKVSNCRFNIKDDEARLKDVLARLEQAKAAEKVAKKAKGKKQEVCLPSSMCKGCGYVQNAGNAPSVEVLGAKAKSLEESIAKHRQSLAKAVAELEKMGEKVEAEKVSA
jgi:DNA repair exonuclease SbcCD ATPase subunit